MYLKERKIQVKHTATHANRIKNILAILKTF